MPCTKRFSFHSLPFLTGRFRHQDACGGCGVKAESIWLDFLTTDLADDLDERFNLVGHVAQQVDVSRWSGRRRSPSRQHQSPFQDEFLDMRRDTESKQKLLHRVVLQNFLKRPVGSLSDLKQSLLDRCGEIRNLPFRNDRRNCGGVAFKHVETADLDLDNASLNSGSPSPQRR